MGETHTSGRGPKGIPLGGATARTVAVVCLNLVVALTISAAGCGTTTGTAVPPEPTTTPLPVTAPTAAAPTTRTSAAPASTTVASTTVSPTSATSSVSTSPPEAAHALDPSFASLARALAPMPTYGWTALPDGVTISEQWWPVVDCRTPDDYEGPDHGNPWVSVEPEAEPQAQFILAYREGWLAVLENYRGDLGEVAGLQVGAVHGRPATLHLVNEGCLVQWSDGGRWYGLFARGIPEGQLVELALRMVLIQG